MHSLRTGLPETCGETPSFTGATRAYRPAGTESGSPVARRPPLPERPREVECRRNGQLRRAVARCDEHESVAELSVSRAPSQQCALLEVNPSTPHSAEKNTSAGAPRGPAGDGLSARSVEAAGAALMTPARINVKTSDRVAE